MTRVPPSRIFASNEAPVNAGGAFVVYWMTAFRRIGWNFSLQRAVEYAQQLNRPLVVLEALRVDYPWASDRLHRFILDGMVDNSRRLVDSPAYHYAYIEERPGAGKGLLEALGSQACVVVTDDYPAFFLPRMTAAAARKLPIRLEKVDSNGLLPLRSTDREFNTAYSFRRFIQRNVVPYLSELPLSDPLAGQQLPRLDGLPARIGDHWPNSAPELSSDHLSVAHLPIDHDVAPAEARGGSSAARNVLKTFLGERLSAYAEDRNHPDSDAASGLSPYLHFGHISNHEILDAVMSREDWDKDRLGKDASGQRSGWWGVSESAEAFLDQLVTWRELGFNMCVRRDDYDQYDALPDWARQTLAEHADDKRPHLYSLADFERARTHDRIWNAAQNQLVREGRLHNYLRMLWGKKILEWSAAPEEALETMIELNNKYALDGRDPNSYSGILWCLGRYDRPWGPERPIFGKIRYMSSKNTARKLRLSEYLQRYAP